MSRPASRSAVVLCVLTALFAGRVLAQALVALFDVTWLPPMQAWYSGLLPYPVLLPLQFAILVVQAVIDRHVWRGRGFVARPGPRAARALRWLAFVYALSMAVRLALAPSHAIPVLFHWVLAAYLLALGRLEPRTTTTAASTPGSKRGAHERTVVGVAALLAVVSLPACTIEHLQIRNDLSPGAPKQQRAPCEIRYSLHVTSGFQSDTRRYRADTGDRLKPTIVNYSRWTADVFHQKGCAATLVERHDDANLTVTVESLFDTRLLPQERLTGISFGAIPSWSTRPRRYIYSLEDLAMKAQHRYIVDEKAYHHVVLFPIFWVNFLLPDGASTYRRALANFIDATGSHSHGGLDAGR